VFIQIITICKKLSFCCDYDTRAHTCTARTYVGAYSRVSSHARFHILLRDLIGQTI